ncbi:hypothetical protein SUDANB145_07340 (plasmid) [Streptomyces sp. enrichment culture]|uniref:hypothetical protein n=1 Tax=Streptomyces sp. enrichment culture TaxID=1795815 RepID=UPI003F546B58
MPAGGRWYSAYDDTFIDGASRLDADHRGPLGEAWDSGAAGWSARERQDFANDLGDSRSLIMVSPPATAPEVRRTHPSGSRRPRPVRCECNAEWIVVKTRWRLSVDPAEKETLSSELAECPNERFTVMPAR